MSQNTSRHQHPVSSIASTPMVHHQPHAHAERGFVTKAPTPYFPHKKPPVDNFVCHGCTERAAILAEVEGLREMVLALSNGMLELNIGMQEQKRRVAHLERELTTAHAATAKIQAQLDRSEQSRFQHYDLGGGNTSAARGASRTGLVSSLGAAGSEPSTTAAGGAGTSSGAAQQQQPAAGLAALVEKMLHNNSIAIEARIAANVRDAEAQRAGLELKSIREEMNRRVTQLQRDVERDLTALESKVDVANAQVAEDVGALSRRFNRAIHQLVESLKETGAHIAAPPAVSDFK